MRGANVGEPTDHPGLERNGALSSNYAISRRWKLPYVKTAWVFALVVETVIGIPLLLGIDLSVPFVFLAFIVVLAAGFGGLTSGLVAGIGAAVVQVSALFLDPERVTQSVVGAVALTLSLGVFVGLLRDALLTATQSTNAVRTHTSVGALPSVDAPIPQDLEPGLLEKLGDAQHRLRNVTRRWVDAQEAERHRLARELHNDIGQCLTALRINLESNKRLFSHDATSMRFIETAYKLVDEVIAKVRELSLELRPSLLDDLGLVAALREYSNKQLSRADIACHVEADGDGSTVDPTQSIATYRIVQEIISNVSKHSNARKVDVRIDIGDLLVRVEIEDDGDGFDVAAAEAGSGKFGLAGMRERAMLVDGDVLVRSTPGEGTCVTLTLPRKLNEASHAA